MTAPGKGADPAAFHAARGALEDEDLTDDALSARLLEVAARSKAARRGVAAAITGSSRAATALKSDLKDPKSAERCLRLAAGAAHDAHERRNPIRRNEPFACDHCGHDVPQAPGGGVRNHCPRCLRSKHVDGAVPGDRTATCDGLMDPVGWLIAGGTSRVTHRCRRCGLERPNRLRFDWADDPDREDVLRALGRVRR